jgi:hypothetical protein
MEQEIKIGDRVCLGKEFGAGSNGGLSWEYGIVMGISDYSLPEALILTNVGKEIWEYVTYLEIYGAK